MISREALAVPLQVKHAYKYVILGHSRDICNSIVSTMSSGWTSAGNGKNRSSKDPDRSDKKDSKSDKLINRSTKCFGCGLKGHKISECKRPRNGRHMYQKPKTKDSDSVNMVSDLSSDLGSLSNPPESFDDRFLPRSTRRRM